VATHPRVFEPPSTLREAIAALDALLASPSVRILAPRDRYWQLLQGITLEAGARGNLAFDAQIVAVCLEHGAGTILTEDRDFRRFPGISIARLG
jgi:predicted nucleic acid-binding protein